MSQSKKEFVEGYCDLGFEIVVKQSSYCSVAGFPGVTYYSFSYWIVGNVPKKLKKVLFRIFGFLNNFTLEAFIPEWACPIESTVVFSSDGGLNILHYSGNGFSAFYGSNNKMKVVFNKLNLNQLK